MKKFLTMILVVTVLSVALVFPVFASDESDPHAVAPIEFAEEM